MRPNIAFLFLLIGESVCLAGSKTSGDYSKLIIGQWLGPRKFEIYHADGRWGVQRNESAPEEIAGRRWHIKGNVLLLTFPGDHGMETASATIVSLTPKKLVIEVDGHQKEYRRRR